jgi:chromosome segregation ATPase
VESDRIKVAIKDQLVKFDSYSKRIAMAKEAAAKDPSKKNKLNAEIENLSAIGSKLLEELAREERVTYNMLTENPGNVKALDKQNSKVTKLKGSIAENERKVAELAAQVDEFMKKQELASELGALQEAYKKCLSNLMNLRSRYTEAYNEAEQEAGIYFLTTPKK